MKNIILLTDLSENSSHASEAGLMLAKKLHADLLLFHSYTGVPVIPYYNYSNGPIPTDEIIKLEDECRINLTKQADHLKVLIEQERPIPFRPQVHHQLGEGNLGNNVEELIAKKNAELVIMGATTESTLEHILSGNFVTTVIEKATCPVLVIPQSANLEKLQKVTFATNFDPADIAAVEYLVKLGRLFNFHYQLEIVHVMPLAGTGADEKEPEMTFIEDVARLGYSRISYKQVRGKDIVDRLNRLCKENSSDLLAMTHHQHSLLGRLFYKSTTNEALGHQYIPLMIFPAKMRKLKES